jgi:hypothetical protein
MYKQILFILFLFCCGIIHAQEESAVRVFSNDTSTILHFTEARLINEDKIAFAELNYNDSTWLIVNPTLNKDSSASVNFSGIVWFRFAFNSNLLPENKTLGIKISQLGASQIYLNGILIYEFGKVAENKEEEIPHYLEEKTLKIYPNKKLDKNVIAIRYSNNRAYEYYRYKKYQRGIKLSLTKSINDESINVIIFILSLLSGMLFSFSIIHFLLFLFYKKEKTNLYYSLHVYAYALILFVVVLQFIIPFTPFILFLEKYLPILFSPFFIFLSAFFYSIYYQKFPLLFKGIVLINIICTITFLINNKASLLMPLIVFYIIISVVECVRVVILSVIKKIPGAKILGIGVLLFSSLLILILFALNIGQFSISVGNSSFLALTILFILFLSLLSIPLSMSVYLAYNFSLTNKTLQKQFLQVEKLSLENLLQEQEKKKILEEQNVTLEKQVKERTEEIIKQKEIVETKQKEILDSIRYAKRIQDAMLPKIKIIEGKIKRLKGRET